MEAAAQAAKLRLPPTLVFTRISLPPNVSLEEIGPDDLPGWDADHEVVSQDFGNRWYDERRSLILLVPSLVAPRLERNVLINQQHPEFERVTASAAAPIVCHPKLLSRQRRLRAN